MSTVYLRVALRLLMLVVLLALVAVVGLATAHAMPAGKPAPTDTWTPAPEEPIDTTSDNDSALVVRSWKTEHPVTYLLLLRLPHSIVGFGDGYSRFLVSGPREAARKLAEYNDQGEERLYGRWEGRLLRIEGTTVTEMPIPALIYDWMGQ